MSNLAALASVAQIGGGAASLGNAYTQSNALRAQGRFTNRQMDQNAVFANMKADQVSKQADWQANTRGLQAQQAIGEYRAKTAGGAVDVNTGSAAKVQEDAAAASAADQATIRQNAALQRWGYGIEAINDHTQGRMARIGGNFGAQGAWAQGAAEATQHGLYAAYYGNQAGWFDDSPTYMRPPAGKRMSDPRNR